MQVEVEAVKGEVVGLEVEEGLEVAEGLVVAPWAPLIPSP